MSQIVAGADVHRNTWRSAETDHRAIGPKMLVLMAAKLPTTSYVLYNEVRSDFDVRAVEVAETLARCSIEEPPVVHLAAARLKRMRLARGYDVIRHVCAKFGWVTQTYSAHENGRIAIPTDQAICYALAFGEQPGRLFFPRVASGEDVSSDGWRWLTTLNQPNAIPVLRMSGGRLVSTERITLPSLMLRGRTGVFALVDESINAEEVLLLTRAEASSPRPLLINDGKAVSFVTKAPVNANFGDPTLAGASGSRPMVVGEVIGKLSARD